MQLFELECASNSLFEIVGTFRNPLEALEFAGHNRIDFALLDIEMPEMNGLELGKRLRELHPEMIIIYVTAYTHYAMDALEQKADYFIKKPYTLSDVEDAVQRAKLLSARLEKRIYIRTFGKFDVFLDGKPITFQSGKAKELLALLVDRNGGTVTTEEMLTYVWEDKEPGESSSGLCRATFSKLMRLLEKLGIPELVTVTARSKYLNKAVCSCDYFSFLDGDAKAIESFNYEYMSAYSWAEETCAKLSWKKDEAQ